MGTAFQPRTSYRPPPDFPPRIRKPTVRPFPPSMTPRLIPRYSELSAQWTFRVSFGIMALMTLWLAYFRYYKTTYSSTALARSKKNARVNQSGYDFHTLKLVSTHFTGRLIGTTMGWLFNDFLFYGNKLFASSFIKVISPGAASNVTTGWLWNLLNVGVALVGYYLAAFLIDHKFYGRKRMQTVGFLADAVLFLIPASKSRGRP